MKGRKYTCFNWWDGIDFSKVESIDTATANFGGIVSIRYENGVVDNRTIIGKARYGLMYPFYDKNINIIKRWSDIIALGQFPDNCLITGDKYDYALNVNHITSVRDGGNGKICVQVNNDTTCCYSVNVGSNVVAARIEKLWKCRKADINPQIVDALERQNRVYSERIAELECAQCHRSSDSADVATLFATSLMCGFAVSLGIAVCLDSMQKKQQ